MLQLYSPPVVSEQACVKYIQMSFQLVCLMSSSSKRTYAHGQNVLYVTVPGAPPIPILGDSVKVGRLSACSVQFGSVPQSCLALFDPMDYSTPGFPVHHQLPELAQTHVHWVGDAIQPSHPLSSPSPPALNLSQHQGLYQWFGSLHQVAKLLELQLQHQSF